MHFRTITLFALLTLSLSGFTQTVQTRYYRDRSKDNEISPDKARYSEAITKYDDGTVTTTLTNLKKNEVESRMSMRGDERVGKWVIRSMSGTEELDYDFVLEYTNKECPSDGMTSAISDFFADNEKLNYVAPKVDGAKGLMDYLRKNLRYPADARRSGVDGTVELTFTITGEGKVEDVKVFKGVSKSIDKEAARVIRSLKLSSPPMMNGQPKRVCVKLPIRFKLA